MIINGKEYPMWSQFVEKKDQFIGKKMFDVDNIMGKSPETIIVDVTLEPNGDDSAMICFIGKDYDCCCDVGYAGVGQSSVKGYMCIYGYSMNFYIESKEIGNE